MLAWATWTVCWPTERRLQKLVMELSQWPSSSGPEKWIELQIDLQIDQEAKVGDTEELRLAICNDFLEWRHCRQRQIGPDG